jgi:ribonucleoside-diphosphate reductase alpha chain
VVHRFELREESVRRIRGTPWAFGFGAFSEIVFHDNYARRRLDGSLESWPDVILRVVNGVLSIRKDWYLRNRLQWDDGYWQEVGEEMALAFLLLKCGPPGRGYFAMGSEYVYERGAMALYNCAATKVFPQTFDRDLGWAMDSLMCGSGVGVETIGRLYALQRPEGVPATYVVPDTREGWVESLEVLLRSYMRGSAPVEFDYSEIRAAGEPIKTFGGAAPGPEPLRKLHERVRERCERFISGEIGATRLVADIANIIGCCVVAGNIRRSAELLIGDPDDHDFLDLKDYDRFPERRDWGWMSNNSVRLSESRHFEAIPKIAERIRKNGEPGLLNLIAMQRFGRFGRPQPDPADLANPCLEIQLCDKEVCNLVETYPSRCRDEKEVIRSFELATLYASTVSLLPTHRMETNAVVSQNRRIGVSISGVADWEARSSAAEMTRILRAGYKRVVAENERLAREAGIRPAIRCTTVKPSGTVSLLAGVSPGGHFAIFEHYIRRKRVSDLSALRPLLQAAGYPCEKDAYSDATQVFEFPLSQPGVRTAVKAGMWEQALQLCMLQREWADNSVSYTVTFDPATEGAQVGNLLAQIAPMVKAISALPRDRIGEEQTYVQPPYEEISERELKLRQKMVRPIDWSIFRGEGTGEADKYCNAGICEVRKTPGGQS